MKKKDGKRNKSQKRNRKTEAKQKERDETENRKRETKRRTIEINKRTIFFVLICFKNMRTLKSTSMRLEKIKRMNLKEKGRKTTFYIVRPVLENMHITE